MDGYILHAQSTKILVNRYNFRGKRENVWLQKSYGTVSDTRVLDNLNANKHLDILQLCQYKNNSKYVNYKYTNNNLKCRKN